MKVFELIELLKAMPQDMNVVVAHDYVHHWRVDASAVDVLDVLDVRREEFLYETEDSEFNVKVISIT